MVPLSPLSFYFTVASTKAVLIPRIKAQEERQEILHLHFSFFFFHIFPLGFSNFNFLKKYYLFPFGLVFAIEVRDT